MAHMFQQVGGDDDLLRCLRHVARQACLARQVQAGVGLVQQQAARAGQQQRQPAHLLALPLAEAGDRALGPVLQAALLQEGQGLRLGLLLAQSLWAQAQGQLFQHGGEDDLVVRVLEHHADPAGALAACGMQVLALAQHPAGVGHFQAAQQAQQTGLAGAVVTDQADARLGQRQAQSVEHRGAATLQAHLLQCQVGRRGKVGGGSGGHGHADGAKGKAGRIVPDGPGPGGHVGRCPRAGRGWLPIMVGIPNPGVL